jgi:hypothetical protein
MSEQAGGAICPKCGFQNAASRDECSRCGTALSREAKDRLRKVLMLLLVAMVIPAGVILAFPLVRSLSSAGNPPIHPPPDDPRPPPAAEQLQKELARAKAAAASQDWRTAQSTALAVLAIDPKQAEAHSILEQAKKRLSASPRAVIDEKELRNRLLEADQAKDWEKLQDLSRRGLEASPDDTFYTHYFKRARGHLALQRARQAFLEGKIEVARAEAELARVDGVSDSVLDQDLEMNDVFLRARTLLDRGDLGGARELLLDFRVAAGEIGRLATFVDAIHIAREEIAKGDYGRALMFFDDARRRMPKSPYIAETLALLRRAHPWLAPELVFESTGLAGLGLPLQADITPGGTSIVFVEREGQGFRLALVPRMSRQVAWRTEIQHALFANSITIACAPNGRLAAVGSTEGSIGFYSTSDGRLLKVARLEGGVRSGFVFDADSDSILVIDGTSLLHRINASTGGIEETYRLGPERFIEAAVASSGEYFLATSAQGEILVWRAGKFDKPAVRVKGLESRRGAIFTSDSRAVVFIEGATSVQRRGVHELQDKKITEGEFADASLVSSQGVVAVWRRRTGHVDVFEASSTKRLSYFNSGFRRIDTMVTSWDGSYLLGLGVVEGTSNLTVRVWSVGR